MVRTRSFPWVRSSIARACTDLIRIWRIQSQYATKDGHDKHSNSTRQQINGRSHGYILPAAVRAALDFDCTGRKPLGADEHLPGHADQVSGCELRARPLVEVVVEHLDPLGGEFAIDILGSLIRRAVALLEIENDDLER